MGRTNSFADAAHEAVITANAAAALHSLVALRNRPILPRHLPAADNSVARGRCASCCRASPSRAGGSGTPGGARPRWLLRAAVAAGGAAAVRAAEPFAELCALASTAVPGHRPPRCRRRRSARRGGRVRRPPRRLRCGDGGDGRRHARRLRRLGRPRGHRRSAGASPRGVAGRAGGGARRRARRARRRAARRSRRPPWSSRSRRRRRTTRSTASALATICCSSCFDGGGRLRTACAAACVCARWRRLLRGGAALHRIVLTEYSNELAQGSLSLPALLSLPLGGPRALSFSQLGVLRDSALQEALPRCSRLRALDLSLCPSLSAAAGSIVASHCQQLVELDLSGLTAIDDVSLADVAAHCASLRAICLNGCTGVGDAESRPRRGLRRAERGTPSGARGSARRGARAARPLRGAGDARRDGVERVLRRRVARARRGARACARRVGRGRRGDALTDDVVGARRVVPQPRALFPPNCAALTAASAEALQRQSTALRAAVFAGRPNVPLCHLHVGSPHRFGADTTSSSAATAAALRPGLAPADAEAARLRADAAVAARDAAEPVAPRDAPSRKFGDDGGAPRASPSSTTKRRRRRAPIDLREL